jgi:hypothetical protein
MFYYLWIHVVLFLFLYFKLFHENKISLYINVYYFVYLSFIVYVLKFLK